MIRKQWQPFCCRKDLIFDHGNTGIGWLALSRQAGRLSIRKKTGLTCDGKWLLLTTLVGGQN